MTTTTATCIRGCTIHGQHTSDCLGDCDGCQKRPVSHGKLCRTCFERLVDFLSIDTPKTSQNPSQGLVLARYWVDHCLDRGITGVAYDLDRVGISKTPPTPVNLARLDLIRDIDDTVSSWLDAWCDHRGLTGPDRYELRTACGYLGSWINEIATWEPIADMWDELATLMSRAHALAPWKREAHRCNGVPCPDCGTTELMVYDGDDVVTCRHCSITFHRDEYARWVTVLADQARPKPISYWASQYGRSVDALRRGLRRAGVKPDATDRNGRKLYQQATLDKWLQAA